jgi:hypothetical protein
MTSWMIRLSHHVVIQFDAATAGSKRHRLGRREGVRALWTYPCAPPTYMVKSRRARASAWPGGGLQGSMPLGSGEYALGRDRGRLSQQSNESPESIDFRPVPVIAAETRPWTM